LEDYNDKIYEKREEALEKTRARTEEKKI